MPHDNSSPHSRRCTSQRRDFEHAARSLRDTSHHGVDCQQFVTGRGCGQLHLLLRAPVSRPHPKHPLCRVPERNSVCACDKRLPRSRTRAQLSTLPVSDLTASEQTRLSIESSAHTQCTAGSTDRPFTPRVYHRCEQCAPGYALHKESGACLSCVAHCLDECTADSDPLKCRCFGLAW